MKKEDKKLIESKPFIDEKFFYEWVDDCKNDEKTNGEYINDYIKEYEVYKDVFYKAFVDSKNKKELCDKVFKFRVDYLLKKPVWREIEVRGDQTFLEFAEMIIESMNWANDHLHAFYLPSKRENSAVLFSHFHTGYSINAESLEDDPLPTYKTNNVVIADIDYDKNPKLGFAFDFGDGYIFYIIYVGTRDLNKKDKFDGLPRLIDQRGVAPEQYLSYYEDDKGEILAFDEDESDEEIDLDKILGGTKK